jgi:hypothetical protein
MDIVDAIAQRDSTRAVRLVRDYNRKVANALNDAGLGPHLLESPMGLIRQSKYLFRLKEAADRVESERD